MSFAGFGILTLFFMALTVTSIVTQLEENLISSRLESDINYIEDLISGNNKNSHWNLRGNAIYFGDVLIGDGTEETANFGPFLEHEAKTGTLAYVFILDRGAELEYVDRVGEAYYEGHYKRVAGSTKSPDGKSIVGTYISKEVSDALDKKGYYSGEAVVAGGLIYCLYNTLNDVDGNVIGAVVVGRNITELKEQISNSVNTITMYMAVIVSLCCVFIVVILSRWISSIADITAYLQEIGKGEIPDQPLVVETKDEMSLVSESINRMVNSLRENTILRKTSETDALTGMPNRLAYDYYAASFRSAMEKKPTTIAVEVLDIDYFKEYNDNYGHHQGDLCLQKIAKEILRLLESYKDIFCSRYGGDEFVIIYKGLTLQEVEDCVIRLRDRIREIAIRHAYSKVSDVVTVTQGICFADYDPNRTLTDYFHEADQALYHIKKVSRNHYRIEDLRNPR